MLIMCIRVCVRGFRLTADSISTILSSSSAAVTTPPATTSPTPASLKPHLCLHPSLSSKPNPDTQCADPYLHPSLSVYSSSGASSSASAAAEAAAFAAFVDDDAPLDKYNISLSTRPVAHHHRHLSQQRLRPLRRLLSLRRPASPAREGGREEGSE